MAKRVLTGCRDCKKCSISGVGKAGRGMGRGLAFAMTGGLSEVAMAATKDCGACGHALSLHQEEKVGGWKQDLDKQQSETAARKIETNIGTRRYSASPEQLWTTLIGILGSNRGAKRDDDIYRIQADLPPRKFMDPTLVAVLSVDAAHDGTSLLRYEIRPTKLTAFGASSNPKEVAKINDRIEVESDELMERIAAGAGVPIDQSKAPSIAAVAPVASEPVAPADDLATQIKRLSDLHSEGILSAEEFAAAKARVLG